MVQTAHSSALSAEHTKHSWAQQYAFCKPNVSMHRESQAVQLQIQTHRAVSPRSSVHPIDPSLPAVAPLRIIGCFLSFRQLTCQCGAVQAARCTGPHPLAPESGFRRDTTGDPAQQTNNAATHHSTLPDITAYAGHYCITLAPLHTACCILHTAHCIAASILPAEHSILGNFTLPPITNKR